MPDQGRPIAFVGATVPLLDGRGGVRAGWTVLVIGDRGDGSGGTIAAAGPDDAVALPEGALTIDARGKFLLPGLVDMHVHIGFAAIQAGPESPEYDRLVEEAADEALLYAVNGVTTVRNMSGAPFHLALARDIRAGRRPGPQLRTTSAILDGAPPVWPFSPVVTDPAVVSALVERIAADGYEAVKIYNHLSRPVYDALAAAARANGLFLVGHVPFAVGIHRALAARQDTIEHFRGYDFDPDNPPGSSAAPARFSTWLKLTDADLHALAEETRRAGTWNCPTFAVMDAGVEEAAGGAVIPAGLASYVPRGMRAMLRRAAATPIFSPEVLQFIARSLPARQALLRLLHGDGGGNRRLLVGTDAPLHGLLPGVSLHRELAAFVDAGLSPEQALVCCCRRPAAFYGEDASWGRVEAGCRADLLLLDADPLADIANTRRIAGVMAAGRWMPRAWCDAALAGLADRHREAGMPAAN